MNTVGGLLVVLHLVGWAIVLGGTLVNLRTGVLAPGVLHGALTALVTGLVLVALLATGALEWGLDWPKMIVKLAVTVAICGAIWAGGRREMAGRPLVAAIAAMTTLNVAVAVLWR